MKGKKTYLVGALAVASAAVLWWFSAIDTGQAATLIVVGLGLVSLRHGLTTERIQLLLELVASYRPSPTGERAGYSAGNHPAERDREAG